MLLNLSVDSTKNWQTFVSSFPGNPAVFGQRQDYVMGDIRANRAPPLTNPRFVDHVVFNGYSWSTKCILVVRDGPSTG
jgi:hypothetical protein